MSTYLATWLCFGLPVTVWCLAWLTWWPGPRDAPGALLWFLVCMVGLVVWSPIGYRLTLRMLR